MTAIDVAIVVPNHNGRRQLGECLESIHALAYPRERVRTVLVDNGSVDGSTAFVRARYPWVRIHENGANRGFSAACNTGARLAGDAAALVFLNNDMRVEVNFLTELVGPLVDRLADCSSAKILSWNGEKVNYAGGGMNFHGIGFQKGWLETPSAAHDAEAPTLFACGGAMAITRACFEDAGGFDEDFFAYYEDSDLGWRLWVLGYRVLYAPRAVCFHHHSLTARSFPPEQIRMLQVRNPLLSIFKNYGEGALAPVLAASLLLAAKRALTIGGIGSEEFRIERTPSRPIGGLREHVVRARRRFGRKMAVPKLALADLVALGDVGELLPRLVEKREAVQRRRKRPDSEILPLFEDPLWCVEPRADYKRLQETVQDFFRIVDLFGSNGRPAPPA